MDVLDLHQEGVLVLEIREPRLEARNAPEFRALLVQRIEQGDELIVLDMAQIEFIDSSALGALIGAIKKMGPLGSIAIARISPTLERLLKLTRMDKVFPIHSTVEEAVEKLKA
ncbi:STAS domain-containing protein [Alkalilacustris brevis]|uniref:STAS domain-containing protein n=1 Tax=Alkalilacustris brevis TaxID=2026338 RepID=UPI000E0DCEFA|nr:STAS domain-containing protein [Alkalilacustris brevis]